MTQTREHRTTRLRLDLAYDGTDFSGWAAQPGRRTVEATLGHWIGAVLRSAEPVRLVVAGRTDAGVHASGQVCHVDLDTESASDDGPSLAATLHRRLARVLPDDLVVRQVRSVTDDFDARFSAVWRRYIYRLWDQETCCEPTLRRRAAMVRPPARLDLEAMRQGAELLLGLHDFAAFCRPREGATTVRELQRCKVGRDPDGQIEIELVADAFCHSMVRSVVGSLVALGRHHRDADWLHELTGRSSRSSEVLVMPPGGLTLEEVGYPAVDQWAVRAQRTRARRDRESATTEPNPAEPSTAQEQP